MRRPQEGIRVVSYTMQEKEFKVENIKILYRGGSQVLRSIVSSETVGKETLVCVLPKIQCIQAFQNLKKATKRDVQVFCGMLAQSFHIFV